MPRACVRRPAAAAAISAVRAAAALNAAVSLRPLVAVRASLLLGPPRRRPAWLALGCLRATPQPDLRARGQHLLLMPILKI